MVKSIFKTAIRSLKRRKSYTLINVLGLALGITCSLVIYRLVRFEKSFDQYHQQADTIYRVVRDAQQGNRLNRSAAMPHPLGDALASEVPGISQVVKIHRLNKAVVSTEGNSNLRVAEENAVAFTESSFFGLFDYQWLAGSAQTALGSRGNVVITRSKASQFFGLEGAQLANALGRTLQLDDKLTVTITGVVENPPANTDFPFDYFVQYESMDGFIGSYRGGQNWMGSNGSTNCYVQLSDPGQVASVEAQLATIIERNKGAEIAKNEEYFLQPLADVHFNEAYGNYSGRTIEPGLINGLLLVGIFIILTACVNFINLSTSLITSRLKEVGVRKILGSTRKQLMIQSLAESLVLTTISALISLALAEMALMNLDTLMGYQLSLGVVNQPGIALFLGTLVLGMTVLSGLYPAFLLSRFRSVDALKGQQSQRSGGKQLIRKGLVVFQFVISQVLIISTIVIVSQLDYVQNTDLGFEHERVIMVPIPNARGLNPNVFRSELEKLPMIEKVGFGMAAPQSASNGNGNWNYAPLALEQDMIANMKSVDASYFDLFQLEIVAGRALRDTDRPNQVVVNESLVQTMGLSSADEAIGKTISTSMLGEATIAGVVADFHLMSMKEEIPSSVLFNFPGYYFNAAIKFSASDEELNTLLVEIDQAWSAQFPDKIFDYEILDDQLADFYVEENRLSKAVQLFATIAIFIGCLGLYGLASFLTLRKSKEIGVRKVLGASAFQISSRFFKEFTKLILIAFLIAAPLSYVNLNSWLNDFAYRIDLGPVIFIASIAISFLIAFITTGYRSHRAATANPVDSLRIE